MNNLVYKPHARQVIVERDFEALKAEHEVLEEKLRDLSETLDILQKQNVKTASEFNDTTKVNDNLTKTTKKNVAINTNL